MNSKKPNKTLSTTLLAGAVAVSSFVGVSCQKEVTFTEGKVFAGGIEADAKTLTEGHDSYMLYCYACHGENGDGKGPSSYGLRPPPRDFTKGIFKFARLRSSDELPNDDDLVRIVHGGLHGTAMLPWDIPEIELTRVLQYIKTFAPQKWEKKKKNGEPVKTLEPFDIDKTPDPWTSDDKGAVAFGRDLYHFRAECVNCHPGYGTKKELYDLSVAAAKREPDKFKPLGGFRDDIYGSVAKDAAEYNQKILPPDFTFTPVRSIRKGSELEDLFRLISFGVYPVMPAWQGAGLSDKDIWALSHYVKHLMDMNEENSQELVELRQREAAQGPFAIPKPEPPPEAAAEKKEGEEAAKDEKADEKKADEKGDKKPEEKAGEKKPDEKGDKKADDKK